MTNQKINKYQLNRIQLKPYNYNPSDGSMAEVTDIMEIQTTSHNKVNNLIVGAEGLWEDGSTVRFLNGTELNVDTFLNSSRVFTSVPITSSNSNCYSSFGSYEFIPFRIVTGKYGKFTKPSGIGPIIDHYGHIYLELDLAKPDKKDGEYIGVNPDNIPLDSFYMTFIGNDQSKYHLNTDKINSIIDGFSNKEKLVIIYDDINPLQEITEKFCEKINNINTIEGNLPKFTTNELTSAIMASDSLFRKHYGEGFESAYNKFMEIKLNMDVFSNGEYNEHYVDDPEMQNILSKMIKASGGKYSYESEIINNATVLILNKGMYYLKKTLSTLSMSYSPKEVYVLNFGNSSIELWKKEMDLT